MPYLYSTLTADQNYTVYNESTSSVPKVVKKIFVNGRANVSNKVLATPRGSVTKVTQEELDLLQKNDVFKIHVKKSHITIEKMDTDVDKVVSNMEKKDSSAPMTPQTDTLPKQEI